jgi:hypothetical protein
MQRRDRSVTVVTVVVGDIMRWVAALVMASVVLAAPRQRLQPVSLLPPNC